MSATTAASKVLRTLFAVSAALVGLLAAVPFVLLAAPFAVVSWLTRRVARWLRPSTVEWTELVEFDPELGWRTRPNLSAHTVDLAGDVFHLSTDADGWKGPVSLEDSDVVVFGDSFAIGFGVDSGTCFTDLAGRPRIKGIGAPAYSLVPAVLWLERLAPRLSGKLVVLLAYVGNDLVDTLRPATGAYRMPFVRESAPAGGWEIVRQHLSPEPWTLSAGQLSYESLIEICAPTGTSRRVFGAFEYLAGRARDACAAAGAELVIASVPELSPIVVRQVAKTLSRRRPPEGFDREYPDRRIAEICERLGVRFIPLARHLTPGDYLERDVHWNAPGHRKVAAVLGDLYREREEWRRQGAREAADARERRSAAGR